MPNEMDLVIRFRGHGDFLLGVPNVGFQGDDASEILQDWYAPTESSISNGGFINHDHVANGNSVAQIAVIHQLGQSRFIVQNDCKNLRRLIGSIGKDEDTVGDSERGFDSFGSINGTGLLSNLLVDTIAIG